MTTADDALARLQVLLQLGRAAAAEQGFRELLQTDPDNPAALRGLARALVIGKRPDEAVLTARQAAAADPTSVDGLMVLTIALLALGRNEEALAVARDTTQTEPRLAGAHRNMGMALLRLSRFTEALDALDRARTLDPENAHGEVQRAVVLQLLGRLPDARRATDRALQLDPENAEAHRIDGMLRLLQPGTGDPQAASRAALQLDPAHSGSRGLHAMTLKARNPLYRWLLRWSVKLEHLPHWVQLAITFAPLVVVQVLRPVRDQTWAQVLVVTLVSLVLLTWALEPLMNATMLVNRAGRGLMSPLMRRSTAGFLSLVVVAIAVAVLGPGSAALTAAAGIALWAIVVGHLGHVGVFKAQRVRIGIGLSTVGAALSAVAMVLVLLGQPLGALAPILLFTGIGMLWYMRFS